MLIRIGSQRAQTCRVSFVITIAAPATSGSGTASIGTRPCFRTFRLYIDLASFASTCQLPICIDQNKCTVARSKPARIILFQVQLAVHAMQDKNATAVPSFGQ
jgi:hypothetical protein